MSKSIVLQATVGGVLRGLEQVSSPLVSSVFFDLIHSFRVYFFDLLQSFRMYFFDLLHSSRVYFFLIFSTRFECIFG